MNDQTLLDLLDLIRNRFFGKYRGVVTKVDPDTMRLKAKVPAVLGDTPTGWCTPCVPYAGPDVGWAFLPEVGSGVWIEFEGGDVSLPIWVGCYWRAGEEPADATETVKVLATKNATWIFDDEGEARLTDTNENGVTLDSDGVTINRGSGSVTVTDGKVQMNDGALEVE
jgi:hypothetical protein